jgi:hypothetical protein
VYLTSSGLQIVDWNNDTHSFSNHLPIKFHVTLYGIWSQSLSQIQTPTSLSSRLTLIYFADHASDSIVFSSLSLEKNLKEISQYLRHFLSLYSAVLGNLSRLEFLPGNESQHNEYRVLDDGNSLTPLLLLLFSHSIALHSSARHSLRWLPNSTDPQNDSMFQ